MNPQNTYWIDKSDTIVRVSDQWDRFALENDSKAACAGRIVGRPLWNFIVGDNTRMWLSTLTGLARVSGKTVERSYRCDSPSLKRYMMMRVSPSPDFDIEIDHDLLHTDVIERPVVFKYSSNKGIRNLVRCSICNKIMVEKQWYDLDTAAVKFGINFIKNPISVIYGVCEPCMASV